MAIPYSKEQQLYRKRVKLKARQRGAISDKVYAAAAERAGGCCERCRRWTNLQAAHLVRRWKLPKTTAQDIAMLCLDCHIWADNTGEGREWLGQYHKKLNSQG